MIQVLRGHVLDVLRTLPDESVHCVVTSPPYWGLRDYGLPPQVWPDGWEGSLGLEPTPELYLEHMVEVFREVKRVLCRDGTAWVNMGDCYAQNSGRRVDAEELEKSKDRAKIKNYPTDAFSGYAGWDRGVNTATSGLKPKDLVGMPWRLAFALQSDGWWLRSDIIWAKCLAHSTRVYARTQKGEMPMAIGDLARLDPSTVELWTGEGYGWVRVRSVSETPQTEGIEIAFRNGRRVSCTPEHKWVLEGLGLEVEARNLTLGMVLKSTTLPNPAGTHYPELLPDTIIGRFVGLYLAEGSRGKQGRVLQFSGHARELERFEWLERVARLYGGTCRMHNTGGNAVTMNVYCKPLAGVLEMYLVGETAANKHLSVKCWMRSNNFLEALLMGYLEGDGHWEEETGRWKLGFTRNDMLADDLRTLCARLGYSIRLRRATIQYQGGQVYGFRGDLQTDGKRRRTEDWEIVGLQHSKSSKFYDVQVDEPHIFALADGLLTHNSNPMPESVTDRPTKSHEYLFLLAKAERYFYDAEAVREEVTGGAHARGEKNSRVLGLVEFIPGVRHTSSLGVTASNSRKEDLPTSRNLRTVWTIPTQPYPEAHFATFPEALVKPCILAGTSEEGCCPECGQPWERVVERGYIPSDGGGYGGRTREANPNDKRSTPMGETSLSRQDTTLGFRPTCSCGKTTCPRCEGTGNFWKYDDPDAPCSFCDGTGKLNIPQDPVPAVVLDPFGGSGTVGVVARKLGRSALLIELNPDYADMAERRIEQVNPTFSEAKPEAPPSASARQLEIEI